MSANSARDEVDDYVEALLGGAMESPAMGAASPETGGAVVEATTSVAAMDAAASRVPAAPAQARSAPQASQPGAAVLPAAHQPSAPATPARTSLAPASNRWLRVAVGSGSYALELLCVQEVVRVAPIVAMRGASRAVLGVMNLRGRIVPVFDLGLWLGTACVQPDERSRIVVVERDDELIGVLVTLVEDVVTLTQNRIEPPLPGSTPGQIVGIARAGAVPTVLLDAGALFG